MHVTVIVLSGLHPFGQHQEIEASISYSGYSLCACSETVIELERMFTIKPEPGFSGSGFQFRSPLTQNTRTLRTK